MLVLRLCLPLTEKSIFPLIKSICNILCILTFRKFFINILKWEIVLFKGGGVFILKHFIFISLGEESLFLLLIMIKPSLFREKGNLSPVMMVFVGLQPYSTAIMPKFGRFTINHSQIFQIYRFRHLTRQNCQQSAEIGLIGQNDEKMV